MDVLCQFSGLVRFPFDQLGCRIELGGWMYSGAHQGIQMYNGGVSLSKQEVTARNSYQEMTVADVNCTVANYFYECCPNEPWPVIIWDFSLTRASWYYFNVRTPAGSDTDPRRTLVHSAFAIDATDHRPMDCPIDLSLACPSSSLGSFTSGQ